MKKYCGVLLFLVSTVHGGHYHIIPGTGFFVDELSPNGNVLEIIEASTKASKIRVRLG